jgi:hypothetical protein
MIRFDSRNKGGKQTVSIAMDARKELRRRARRTAWMEGKPGQLIACTIFNLSNNGAQLVISADLVLPSLFVLRLTEDGKEKRACRIIWRKGSRTGVRFFALSSPAIGQAWAS